MGTASSKRLDTRTHEHPFSSRNDKIEKTISCKICVRSITAGPYYVCDICEYYIHESCYALPHQIYHSFHPSHALTLHLRDEYWCGSCHKHFSGALSYRCDKDDFDMDIECALMPPMTCEGQTHIQHFSHQHPMPLLELGGRDETQCFACQSTSSGAFYGCTKCEYFLHKSCAELPTNYEFRHTFHSDHGLYQLCVQHKPFCCSSCNKNTKCTFVFECTSCDFMMCVKCCNKKYPTIKYKYHEHLLCLTEYYNLDRCKAYDGYCQSSVGSKELDATKYHVFGCKDCSFNVHLLCGPLPRIIKHESHLHSLSLAPSIIEDTSGVYYCDYCETERDPRVRFYCCEECKYTAHVRCVILEVLNVLNGDLKDVELKVVREDLWENEIGKEEALTMLDMINALPSGQIQWIRDYYKWESTKNLDSHSTSHFKVEDEDIDEAIKFSRSSENDFKSFMEEISELNRKRRPIEVPSNFKLKVVNVEGYKIPFTLAPVMRTLLHKYGDVRSWWFGDISGWWFRGQRKSFAYSILCEVLEEMSSTIVEDVTKNMICDWYYHLSFLEFAEFETKFLREHLEGLTHAFVGRQAKRVEDEIPTKLRQQIAKKKAQLEICEKFGTSSKSRFLEEGLNKASEWKWKRAHQGLF